MSTKTAKESLLKKTKRKSLEENASTEIESAHPKKKFKKIQGSAEGKNISKQQNEQASPSATPTDVGNSSPQTPKASRKESRKEQKELAKQRRLNRPNADLVERLKPLWDVIRKKDLKKDEKAEKLKEAMNLVRGHVGELAVKIDSSRILQSMITYANEDQRLELAKELTEIFNLAGNEYAMHVLKKLVNDCGATRTFLLKSIKGKIFKLFQRKSTLEFLNELYHRSNSGTKMQIVAELYSSEFGTLDLPKNIFTIKMLLEKYPGKKDVILENIRKALDHFLNKQLLNFEVVQRVVDDYLTIEIPSKLQEKTGLFLEHVEAMTGSVAGCTAVVKIIAAASAKDRKSLVKTFKAHLETMLKSPHQILVLISLLKFVDDTVLVGKAIVQEIGKNLSSTILDKNGMRVVMFLLAGSVPKYITPYAYNLFMECETLGQATSKKDPSLRQRELLEYFMPFVKELIESDWPKLVRDEEAIPFVIEYMELSGDSSMILEKIPVDDPSTNNFLRTLVKRSEKLALDLYSRLEGDMIAHLKEPTTGFLFAIMTRYASIHNKMKGILPDIIESCEGEGEAAKLLASKLKEDPQDREY